MPRSNPAISESYISATTEGEKIMLIEWVRKEGCRWVVECRTDRGTLFEFAARTLPAALALAERYGARRQA